MSGDRNPKHRSPMRDVSAFSAMASKNDAILGDLTGRSSSFSVSQSGTQSALDALLSRQAMPSPASTMHHVMGPSPSRSLWGSDSSSQETLAFSQLTSEQLSSFGQFSSAGVDVLSQLLSAGATQGSPGDNYVSVSRSASVPGPLPVSPSPAHLSLQKQLQQASLLSSDPTGEAIQYYSQMLMAGGDSSAANSMSPTPRTSTSGGGVPTVTSASLYVKNLPPETDELFLYQKFAPHGALLSCKVQTDPTTGKCRGVGFVNFVDQTAALRAMQQLHGTRISEGRQLHITLQAPRAVRAAAAAAATSVPHPGGSPHQQQQQHLSTSQAINMLRTGSVPASTQHMLLMNLGAAAASHR